MSKLLLDVQGREFQYFTDISVSKSMENMVGTFSFGATNSGQKTFPFKKGDSCQVKIDNLPIITGFIDGLSFFYSSNNHNITVIGSDLTSDIVDSTVKGNMVFKSPVSLTDVIKIATEAIGLNLTIINNAGEIKKLEKSEIATAKTGQNLYDFVEQHTKQRQVFLNTTGEGQISLIRGGNQEKLPVALVNQFGEPNVNIISANSSDRDEERFNTYRVVSQGNPISGLDDADLTGKNGTATDSAIRSTRFLEKEAETRSDVQTVEDRAKWESNIRRTRGFEYTCTVRGYYNDEANGVIWEPNKLVQVKDDFAQVDAELLIKDVTWSLSTEGGSLTTMTMVNKDAFTLLAQENAVEAKFNKTGLTASGIDLGEL